MSALSDHVYQLLEPLSSRWGFFPAKAYAGQRFASLVRRCGDDYYQYIFVHDRRVGNAEMSMSLWFGPPHAPDDSLDQLYVGSTIAIASTYEVTDDFFLRCVTRLDRLLAVLEPLGAVVQQELQAPSFETARYKSYIMEREAYGSLKHWSEDPHATAAQHAFEIAAQVARGRKALNHLEKACQGAATELLESNLLASTPAAFFGGDSTFLGHCLVGLVYIHALTGESR